MLAAAYEDIEGSPGVAMASSTPISFDKLTGSASWGKNKRAAITSVATSLGEADGRGVRRAVRVQSRAHSMRRCESCVTPERLASSGLQEA